MLLLLRRPLLHDAVGDGAGWERVQHVVHVCEDVPAPAAHAQLHTPAQLQTSGASAVGAAGAVGAAVAGLHCDKVVTHKWHIYTQQIYKAIIPLLVVAAVICVFEITEVCLVLAKTHHKPHTDGVPMTAILHHRQRIYLN